MPLEPIVLLVPSSAAARELPRRLASVSGAVAAVYPVKLVKPFQLEGTGHGDLARAVAEPALLSAGLRPWQRGHDTLLAARLLEQPHGLAVDAGLSPTRMAEALARTLSALRTAGITPEQMEALPSRAAATSEDAERLRAVAALYRRFHDEVDGRVADLATVLREAARRLDEARWLDGAEVLIVDDLELTPLEWDLLEALARRFRVRLLERVRPPALVASSFAQRAAERGVGPVRWEESPLRLLAPPAPASGASTSCG